MRVPLDWLRELCPIELAPEALAERLTMHGVQVERILRPWAGVTGVVVARVLDVRDHPAADKLCVTTIESGAGEHTVVAGVRNMAPGDLVPWARPGATLPGMEGTLERRSLRGVQSDGMLCSPRELAISADHGGILVLPPGLDPGRDVTEALRLDVPVLEIEVHPNRADLLSVLGVARETAMATGSDLFPPDASVDEGDAKAADAATVAVVDRRGCPRYVARIVAGVGVGPAPLAVQVRLTAAGMRPVSNVVDATNYAMLELGHPMHPFDLSRLAGRGIVVRRASDGERMVTLDGVERTFTDADVLIADAERAVGVAGVMGSAAAEVGESTTEVLVEAAYFDPATIYRTARRLGIRTEASIRFVRGADPEAPAAGAARAARLMAAWSGGT
ncbi:MAG: phenylalanine--tRNA ligase subunit beta, partial [Actinomycetota bacterium]|nr:phenylalanine--tRNA ligase subunit beta [Actinomycetota bacterium]